MKRIFVVVTVCLAVALLAMAGAGCVPKAEEYPSRPITIACGWAAGGDSDAWTRVQAAQLERKLGVPVNVINISGPYASVALTQVMTELPADGYTLSYVDPNQIIPRVLGTLEIPDQSSEAEVILLGGTYMSGCFMGTREDSDYDTFQDFVDVCKARPGEIRLGNAAVAGTFTIPWLIYEAESGLDFVIFAAGGTGPLFKEFLAGRVELATGIYPSWKPYLGSEVPLEHKLRLLCCVDKERFPEEPDVPTLVEMGYEDAYYLSVYGLAVRPGTPPEIVETLRTAYAELGQDPEFYEALEAIGCYTGGFASPEEYREASIICYDRYVNLREAGII